MRVAVTFRNLDPSPALKEYAEQKLSKLQKYLRAPLDAEVTVSQERHLRTVHMIVTGDGGRYEGTEDAESAQAAIDLVMDKVDRQVREHLDEERSRKRSAAGIKSPDVLEKLG